ncbi:RNA 3'-terminal phosphate cyclase [Shewanella sp. C32]|uniref:RNA 3'-terminal phosphate cyclase n=1 Tax=Shewanella electrica TaxID=515560 RepID=A0ABT2FIT7_9GAMM|nr:RNA 3'-terminal phosphate cyclase [Shewanella electrica]MCH1924347.1 RNA 3'-terminal phosphate cyclase [Shewanella electrica]MCS4556248.1 RNA 3'-terminal phosphate cyclase [Shewanella electrica]
MITIDGAQGEGGGQVLRSALTIALLTGTPLEVINIRAGRHQPGLLRQHLACVRAAQAISNGHCEGAALGSQHIRFTPKAVNAGNYQFAIGSAGSTVLVCQTILLPLALANGVSQVQFAGGTHNGWSPSLTFFERSFLPLLRTMGVQAEVTVEQLGFHPAGGGRWQLTIKPCQQLQPLRLTEGIAERAARMEYCAIDVIQAELPASIVQREIATTQQQLNWADAATNVQRVTAACPGNSLHLSVACADYHLMVEQIGERRLSAETLAKTTATQLQALIKANVAVDEYLADQLLLPIAIAGEGSFTTVQPSLHTQTNIAVIAQMLGKQFSVTEFGDNRWRIALAADG